MPETLEISFPFAALDKDNPDRSYSGVDQMDFDDAFFTSGIVAAGNQLVVTAGGGMTSVLGTGMAMLKGGRYINPAPVTFTHDPADGVLDRIDRIVIKLSMTDRSIKAYLYKGTPDVSPVPPEITQNDNRDPFELARADIAVNAGATEITSEDITDNMFDSDVCGVITARGELDTAAMQAKFNTLIAHLEQDIADAEGGALYELKRLVFDNTVVLIADFTAFEKTDGENWFDGYFEQGTLGDPDGAESASDYHVRSLNDIAVTAGDVYSYSDSIGNGARLFWYSDSAFISHSDVADSGNATAPTGATKLRIRLYDASGIEPADVNLCMVNYGSTALEYMDYIDAEVYPYQAKVALDGVLSNMDTDVRFGPIASKISAPVANAYTGGVKLYVSEVPDKAVVIPTIICLKAV